MIDKGLQVLQAGIPRPKNFLYAPMMRLNATLVDRW